MAETTADDAAPPETPVTGELGEELGDSAFRSGSWFTRLVMAYLRRYASKQSASPAPAVGTESERALKAIRWAAVRSAITGAASGATTTSATIITAETQGIGGLVAIPVAVAGIFGEMVYRAIIHLELTCQLAEIFGLRIDPEDPSDLWRIYALAFEPTPEGDKEGEERDPGQGMIHRVLEVQGEEVGHHIGAELLGESMLRNVVPVLGIASSSITNYRLTRRLGDTVRRFMRYQRALQDALAHEVQACSTHLDLLIEGIWFVFSADGALKPEEVAILAWLLKKCEPVERHAISSRFVEDDHDWLERIEAVAPALRPSFYHALEVAAAVDKAVTLPERRLLRGVARHLDLTFDLARLHRMMDEFEDRGVIAFQPDDVALAP
jgi:hypothetical protein